MSVERWALGVGRWALSIDFCTTCSGALPRCTYSSIPTKNRVGYIEEVIEGSTIGEVLSMTQWDKVELMRLLKTQVDAAIKGDRLKPSDAMKLLSDYERLLQEYTYLSFNGPKPIAQPGNWLPLS